MNRLSLILPASLLGACTSTLEPYYSSGSAPSISGLSVESQVGSLPGEVVVIDGEKFGGDPDAVTVLFGSQNADVVSVGEDTITVIVPHGPISGGEVDVVVGTAGGQARLSAAYTYELPTRADNQIAYITIANDGTSCYGGIYGTDIRGCDGFAYTGDSGISARAEGFEFAFPKAHIPYSLGKGGFAQANSIAWEQWRIVDKPFDTNTADLEGNTENQRVKLGKITLTNPVFEGEEVCVDLAHFAEYTYNNGDPLESDSSLLYPSTSVFGASPYQVEDSRGRDLIDGDLLTTLRDEGDCSAENVSAGLSRVDALDTLELCEVEEFEFTNTYVYEADWLASQSFFADGTSRSDVLDPVDVFLNIPNAGLEDVPITLPEAASFDDRNDGFNWVLRPSITSGECVDDDDVDRTTDGGDAVFTWQWEPSSVVHAVSDDGPVKSVDTYVVVTLSYFAFSWLGGEGLPMMATIAVPDDYNYDDETGLSTLSLPTWVMYSFPSAGQDYGFSADGEWIGWGQPDGQEYGFSIVTIDRVTEYTISPQSDLQTVSGESVSGDIVLAYTTGDMGLYFFDNPLDNQGIDSCADCIDNDGDGWVDAQDPDCIDGTAERNATSDYTCNNGLDDDGDGDIDWLDEDCVDGLNGEVNDCTNGLDDDGDGWIDSDDPDCMVDIFEDGELSSATCNNGIDDDNDGWIDSEDLACGIGSDSEDDGTTDFACNNGIDDDGHGDADADDLLCRVMGADYDLEEELSGDCADGIDNDSDGYTDGYDPDCDLGASELYASSSEFPADAPAVSLACYNGVDDDKDTVTDAADPGCVNALTGEPDGFAPDEAAADPAPDTCSDNIDNDSDGWIDDDDPDCGTGSDEVSATSANACNDGIDNDIDGDVDADDSDCDSGFDNNEAG